MHLEGTMQPTRYQVFVMRTGLCELLTTLIVCVVRSLKYETIARMTSGRLQICLLPR